MWFIIHTHTHIKGATPTIVLKMFKIKLYSIYIPSSPNIILFIFLVVLIIFWWLGMPIKYYSVIAKTSIK
jgi:hypothetical protein